MSSPKTLTEETSESEVIESSLPVLVDFWADWCGPCQMVSPIVEQLAQEYDGQLKVGKVDVDVQQQVAADFGIRSIPTLLLFKDGEIADQIVGAVPKAHLVEKIQAAL